MYKIIVMLFLLSCTAFGDIRETFRNGGVIIEDKGLNTTIKKNYNKRTFYETYNSLVNKFGKDNIELDNKNDFIRVDTDDITMFLYYDKDFIMITTIIYDLVEDGKYNEMGDYVHKNMKRYEKKLGFKFKWSTNKK